MKITKDFINSHRTKRGGFAYAQCVALGEMWPPKKGWIDRAVEAEHTPEAIDRFIKGADREAAKLARKQHREERLARRFGHIDHPEKKIVQKKPKPALKKDPRYAGDPNGPDFLQSFQWRKLRMEVLRRYGPVCMCCGASAKTGATIHVDHIKPRRKYPQLALSFDNLQVLCHECNHGKGNWDETDWRPVDDTIDPEVSAFIKSIADER